MPRSSSTSAAQFAPSESDRQEARNASRALARLTGHHRVRVEAVAEDNGSSQTFILPTAAVRMLTDMLAHLAEGKAVAVIPNEAELTTQEAAEMLNVSRPYLVKLLEKNAIPYHKAGTHRRVLFCDLQAYRERAAKTRREALAALVADGQELGI